MAAYDIVVVGGSAGSIEPAKALVRSLPSDFGAAVCVVMHLASDFPSTLDGILGRAGALPAIHPADGETLRAGHIYVAPPDYHLTLEPGVLHVERGPRENRHRPAIDPLFRTAARAYGPRVIGVILSGFLDDGVAGLLAIRASGGVAIVQDPEDARAPQMPEAALRYGGADFVLRSEQIGPKIVELVASQAGGTMAGKEQKPEQSLQEPDDANLRVATASEGVGTPSVFACPECHGVLWELKDGSLVHFRCRVGHAYTMTNLHKEQGHAIENALWAAMRALEEKSALERRLAESMSDTRMAERFREQEKSDRNHADAIRNILFQWDEPAKKAA